ncbi:MAG: thioredoxin family protein, partial [Planctomycetota bacterium]
MSRKHLRLLSAIALLAITSTSAHAQDSVWLNDFNAAREKATTEKKPIIIDFGTVNCFWCKKLDMTTFRDPAVAKRLAEQFVAVRIDADKEAALARHLGVSSYPTLVFAAHDGRILGQHVGYVETPRFQQQLDRALSDNGKAPKA